MSTFGGRFADTKYKNICIDNFLPENYDCTAFFLSHFHSDHMRGIYESTFHSLFERKSSVMFYCHELTRRFIVACSDIKIPEYRLKALDSEGTDIELEEDLWVKVTWLSAGHCPGSVMLLFEAFGERILYSGDIRLSLSDVASFAPLHYMGEPLPLDALYLDTTFASQNYLTFPHRRDSLAKMKTHIEDWLTKDKQNRVCILPPASIGIEFLMIELHRAFEKKVHVSKQSWDRFLCFIPHVHHAVSTDPDNAKIHFCNFSNCDNCFRVAYHNDNLLIIKPSALYFTQPVLKEHGSVMMDSKARILRVCYSSHCSCEELVEFVRYLKPDKLYPCVVPPYTSADQPNQFFLDFLGMCSRKGLAGEEVTEGSSTTEESSVEDELARLTEPELFVKVVSNYLFRPIQPAESQPDLAQLIQRLDLATPT